jgi:hypothetical protein
MSAFDSTKRTFQLRPRLSAIGLTTDKGRRPPEAINLITRLSVLSSHPECPN